MRIFLIRHGESVGNINDKAYGEMQDHNVPLTEWGFEQSVAAGKFLKEFYENRDDIADKKLRIWYSPFIRAVQTKDGFIKGFGKKRTDGVFEDFLLGEQDFGIFSDIPDEKEQERLFPAEFKKVAACREKMGKFYARPPMGESRADVAQRVRLFVETLMRDANRGRQDFAIIAHGVTNRAFEMTFMHKGVAWFEKEPNPGNCDIVLIEGDRHSGYSARVVYKGKLRGPQKANTKTAAYKP